MTPLLDDEPPTFVVRFVGVAGRCPAGCALAGDGRKWTRHSDESDEQFEDRVLGALPATTHYVFFPIGTDLEDHHEHDHRQDQGRTFGIARSA